MSDLFHEEVPDGFVSEIWDVMLSLPRHTFQVLTKRPERARDWSARYLRDRSDLGSNVWLGVSIENSRYTFRADVLQEIPAFVRFVSAEPLLGSLFEQDGKRKPLTLTNIDWLIAGGESGPGARPVDVRWVRELRDACAVENVPFFFKQWGGRTPKAGGRHLDGRQYDEMPQAATA
jgi:protein gp37